MIVSTRRGESRNPPSRVAVAACTGLAEAFIRKARELDAAPKPGNVKRPSIAFLAKRVITDARRVIGMLPASGSARLRVPPEAPVAALDSASVVQSSARHHGRSAMIMTYLQTPVLARDCPSYSRHLPSSAHRYQRVQLLRQLTPVLGAGAARARKPCRLLGGRWNAHTTGDAAETIARGF